MNVAQASEQGEARRKEALFPMRGKRLLEKRKGYLSRTYGNLRGFPGVRHPWQWRGKPEKLSTRGPKLT